jgi:hypothetical protein
VEYRWLMDEAIELDANSFVVSKVMVNNLLLNTRISHNNGCVRLTAHPELARLLGKALTSR